MRSLICPTTFQARDARSLRSLVQSASCTAVEASRAHLPMRPMFPSQACWKQFLSINLCCSQWQPTPPFKALPAGFLTTLRQFPATASFAMPVSHFR